jgi:hypothetical protein
VVGPNVHKQVLRWHNHQADAAVERTDRGAPIRVCWFLCKVNAIYGTPIVEKLKWLLEPSSIWCSGEKFQSHNRENADCVLCNTASVLWAAVESDVCWNNQVDNFVCFCSKNISKEKIIVDDLGNVRRMLHEGISSPCKVRDIFFPLFWSKSIKAQSEWRDSFIFSSICWRRLERCRNK